MINLFVNFYNDNNSLRQKEINECLSRNIANPMIDRIYLVVESNAVHFYGMDTFQKTEIVICNGRPTFSFLFNLANTTATDDDTSIISNSDIYFEEYDVSLISCCLKPDSCFVLTRWNRETNGSLHLFDRPDSQDSWAFKGPIKNIGNCDFTMGKPGCDNAIAERIEAAGYHVLNPSRDIKSIHVHNTGIRNYDHFDSSQIIGLPYRYIHPGCLENIPVTNWVTEIGNLSMNGLQSQFGEEAIVDHIFNNIGITDKYFVDLGAGAYGESTMSNTRKLLQTGWKGYGVDMNNKGESWIIERFITPDNILQIFAEQHTPVEFDFLTIDIDSSDFWVLARVLEKYAPRCICTEFNGTLDPYTSLVLKYEEDYTWDETNKYGYSFIAGKKLLCKHGYRVIYNMHDQNLFALKKELVKGLIFNVTATQSKYHRKSQDAVWELF